MNQESVLNGPIKIIKKILVIVFLDNSDWPFYLQEHCIGKNLKTLTWTVVKSLTRLQILNILRNSEKNLFLNDYIFVAFFSISIFLLFFFQYACFYYSFFSKKEYGSK